MTSTLKTSCGDNSGRVAGLGGSRGRLPHPQAAPPSQSCYLRAFSRHFEQPRGPTTLRRTRSSLWSATDERQPKNWLCVRYSCSVQRAVQAAATSLAVPHFAKASLLLGWSQSARSQTPLRTVSLLAPWFSAEQLYFGTDSGPWPTLRCSVLWASTARRPSVTPPSASVTPPSASCLVRYQSSVCCTWRSTRTILLSPSFIVVQVGFHAHRSEGCKQLPGRPPDGTRSCAR